MGPESGLPRDIYISVEKKVPMIWSGSQKGNVIGRKIHILMSSPTKLASRESQDVEMYNKHVNLTFLT
jgi:hypothetical protein